MGVWPPGVDFRQVHSASPRLLAGDGTGRGKTGGGGGEEEEGGGGNLCSLQSLTEKIPNSKGPVSTRLHPPQPLPPSLPNISLIDWNASGQ